MRTGFVVVKDGARDRNRTGTPVIHEAADFKSDVSTSFTTRAYDAVANTTIVKQKKTRSCVLKGPIDGGKGNSLPNWNKRGMYAE